MWLTDFVLKYSLFMENLPMEYRILINVVFFTTLIVLYLLLSYYIAGIVSRRDLFNLDLKKYNVSKHPVFKKMMAVLLYIIEYILVLPFMVTIWFAFLSIFILISSPINNFEVILMIGGSLVLAVRIISYTREDISREIAVLMPVVLLYDLLINPDFFIISKTLEKLVVITSLFHYIIYFIFVIFAVEFIMRILHLMFTIGGGEEKI